MFTIILAFINAKFNMNYELLFLGTFVIDVIIVEGLIDILKIKQEN